MHKGLRRTFGLSLIELLAAVTIVTILASSAYVGYQNYVDDAQQQRVRHDLETLSNALQTYDRDHPTQPYSRNALDDLKGRYIDDLPADPWGNDYVVDTVIKRVVSPGPDRRLQTSIPGHFDSPDRTDPFADDVRRPYAEQGVISFVAGDTLTQMRPDGSERVSPIANLPAGAVVNQAPDGNRVLVSASSKITLYTKHEDQPFETRDLSFGPLVVGGREGRWAPDGDKFAFIAVLPSGEGVAIGDVTTDPVNVNGQPAVVVTSSVAGATYPQLVKGNRELVFGDAALNIYRVSAVEQSTLTTLNVNASGVAENDGAHPAVSNDGKLIAYVSNAAGGDVYVRSTSQALKQLVARGSWREVAFGPTGQLLAMTDGSRIVITTARPSQITSGLPLLVVDGVGSISSLSWR